MRAAAPARLSLLPVARAALLCSQSRLRHLLPSTLTQCMVQQLTTRSMSPSSRRESSAEMPRKLGVGMPKRRKTKVPVVEAVAAEAAATPAVTEAEEPPPASPNHKHKPSPARAPPPSPGAVKLKGLEAAAAKAARVLRRTASNQEKALCSKRTGAQLFFIFEGRGDQQGGWAAASAIRWRLTKC